MSYKVDYSVRLASWYVNNSDGERISDLYDTSHDAWREWERLTADAGGDVVIIEHGKGVEW